MRLPKPGSGGSAADGAPCWPRSPAGSPAGPAPAALHGEHRADVAVVGAGLLGLTTALLLAEANPSRRVVVVDAAAPAAGASGRGTGLLGPRVGPPVERARRRFGDAVARRMFQASIDAVRDVHRLTERLGIDCGLRTGGQLTVARSPRQAQQLRRRADCYRDLGFDVPLLSPDEVHDRIAMPGTAALLYREAATLDPAALTLGLAAAAEKRGVRVYGHSPVLSLRPDGTGHRLDLPAGRLQVDTVVVAVNAYAGGLGLPIGTVLPLEVHAVATAPLDEGLLASIWPSPQYAVIDADPLAPYLRTTPDRRLVIGGGRPLLSAGLSTGQRARHRAAVWTWLTGQLRARHPRLADVAIDHRWSGPIAMTTDGLPVVGPVTGRPGLWYAGGCNGHGLAMSVAHAHHLARRIDGGAAEPAEPWHRSQAPWLPIGAAARPLLRVYLSHLDRRVRRDLHRTRREGDAPVPA